MLFAAVHESVFGTSRPSLRRNSLDAIGPTADKRRFGGSIDTQRMVESRCGAVALGRTYLLPPLSSGGALLVQPWLRFHIPLIEPDVRRYRIRLSDKTSRFAFACNAIGSF